MSPQKTAALKRKARGQGMTEYVIIVALIAIATVAVITIFGNNIRELFAGSAEVLAGNQAVKNDGTKSVNQRAVKKTLADYSEVK